MTLRRKQSKQTVEYVAPEKILCRVPGPTLQGNPAAKCPPSTTRSCGKMSGAARHKQLFFFCQTAGEPPNVSPSSESERERHWQLVRRLCHVGKTHHAQTFQTERHALNFFPGRMHIIFIGAAAADVKMLKEQRFSYL